MSVLQMLLAISVLNGLLLVPALFVVYCLFVWTRDTYRGSGKYNVLARRVACPRYNSLMPVPRKPTSFRQAMRGGWTCESCGCEMNAKGVELPLSK